MVNHLSVLRILWQFSSPQSSSLKSSSVWISLYVTETTKISTGQSFRSHLTPNLQGVFSILTITPQNDPGQQKRMGGRKPWIVRNMSKIKRWKYLKYPFQSWKRSPSKTRLYSVLSFCICRFFCTDSLELWELCFTLEGFPNPKLAFMWDLLCYMLLMNKFRSKDFIY